MTNDVSNSLAPIQPANGGGRAIVVAERPRLLDFRHPSTIMNLGQGRLGLCLYRRPGRQARGHTGGLC